MIIYGKQLFLYALQHKPHILQEVYLAKECDKKLFHQVQKLNVPIIRPDFKKAQALAKGGNHQGFLAKIEPLEFYSLSEFKDAKFIVLLYGLSDVGNIGAICRSAYALGADGIVICGVKSINLEGILRTSSGAAFDMPMAFMPNGLDALNELKMSGFYLYATDAKGKDIKKVQIKDKKVLVLGSEGEGISRKAMLKCDESVSINMVRAFDSLNVSAACAILCDRIMNG